MQDRKPSWTWPRRRVIAYVVVALYALTAFIVGVQIAGVHQFPFNYVNPQPEHLKFQIPYGILPPNGSAIQPPEVKLGLNFDAPDGLVVAGESITVSGVAEVNKTLEPGLTAILVGFQNSIDSKVPPDSAGIYTFGTLRLFPTQNLSLFQGSTELYWPTEGDYLPIVYYVVGNYAYQLQVSNDVFIHVYPTSQLAQEHTNRLNLTLTWALFVLTTFGVATVFIELWDVPSPPADPQKQSNDLKEQPK